jgi:uncharacterized membrane protein YfcA
MDFLLPLIGFAVGLLVGLSGMGAGVIMTPVLILGLGLPPTTAVGTDLAYAMLTKLAGAWQHWRQGTVDFRVVRHLALGSLPAAFAAVALLVWLRRFDTAVVDAWVERAIGLALIIAAGLILHRVFRAGQPVSPVASLSHRWTAVVLIGALGGFLVGLTSVGSGSIMLALLVFVSPLPPEKLVGTDLAHAALLVGATGLIYLYIGHVELGLAAQLVVGSVPGAIVGSRLTLQVPRRMLQVGLAGILIASAYKLLL